MKIEKQFWSEDFIKHMVITEYGDNCSLYDQTDFIDKMKERLKYFLNDRDEKERKEIEDEFLNHPQFQKDKKTERYSPTALRKITHSEKKPYGLSEKTATLVALAYNYDLNKNPFFLGTVALGIKTEERKSFSIAKSTPSIKNTIPNTSESESIRTSLNTFGQLEIKLLELLMKTNKSIHFYYTDREINFILNYVLSYFTLLKKGINLEVTYFQTENDEAKRERGLNKMRNLKYLGASVRVVPLHACLPPFVGVISDPTTNNGSILSFVDYQQNIFFTINENPGESIINAFLKGYSKLLEQYKVESFTDFIPEIKPISETNYKEILKWTPAYKSLRDEDIEFVKIPIEVIGGFFTHQVKGIKKFKIQQHLYFNRSMNLNPELIYGIKMKNDLLHVINIPIIEKINNNYYIIEGHTRLKSMWDLWQKKKDLDPVYVALVDYTHLMTDTDLEEIGHVELAKLKENTDYSNHTINKTLYNRKIRNIESYTHGSDEYDWKKLFPLEIDTIRN